MPLSHHSMVIVGLKNMVGGEISRHALNPSRDRPPGVARKIFFAAGQHIGASRTIQGHTGPDGNIGQIKTYPKRTTFYRQRSNKKKQQEEPR